MKKVRVRFAPSPTGYLHIGGLRTALYNYLFAKKEGGVYILRIEDTDQTRYVEGAIEALINSSAWAGVVHDEGPYIQSERLPLYKKCAEELIEKGFAYYCFCDKDRLEKLRDDQKNAGDTPKYDGKCRDIPLEEARRRVAAGEEHVVRLKLPENRVIKFTDLVKGEISVNTDDLDDQVLMKSDGYPTYHMAVVVDDNDMGITHVLRGDEWLISTPKHVYLYEAFGWEQPVYVHLPVILGDDKKKLSKRQGDVAVHDFERKGFLPEALVNYIALVGWSSDDGSEIMSMQEMIDKFSLDRISHSGGVFSIDKLRWFNNHYIRIADIERLYSLCKPHFVSAGFCTEDEYESNKRRYVLIIEALRERLGALSDIADFKDYYTAESVSASDSDAADIMEEPGSKAVVASLKKILTDRVASGEAAQISGDEFKAVCKQVGAETSQKGKGLFMPIRIAISGEMHGPDLASTAEILGARLIIKRLESWE